MPESLSDEELQAQWGDARGADDGNDVTEDDPVVDEDYEEDDEPVGPPQPAPGEVDEQFEEVTE